MVFHEIKLLLQIKYAKLLNDIQILISSLKKNLKIMVAPSLLEGPIHLLKISEM